jgi:hypothetical protein
MCCCELLGVKNQRCVLDELRVGDLVAVKMSTLSTAHESQVQC